MNDLSQDLQNLIYFDYLQINILNSNLCQQLNHFELSTMLKNILTHQQFVNYLKQNNRLFNDLLIIYYFVNLELIDSFALSWLMYLYH